MRTHWANILTPRRSTAEGCLIDSATVTPGKIRRLADVVRRRRQGAALQVRRAVALALCLVLVAAMPADVLAQNSRSKKRSKKSKAPACKNCKPETKAPEIPAVSVENAALQKELTELGHGLRTGAAGG